jgi:hypothetical protein
MAGKESRTIFIGFLAGLALVAAGVVGASRLKQKDAGQEQYRSELADATPVQQGQMTDKQRIHSRFYSEYGPRMSGKRISDLVAQAKDKSPSERILGVELLVGSSPVLTEQESPDAYFGRLARMSDAVVRGTVLKKTSQVTEDDGFVFTDYDLEVKEVLKNTGKASLESGSVITVTRPGGKIVKDGVIIKVTDNAIAPLPVSHDVVLFLRLIQETGAYKATSGTGALELQGSSVRPLTGEHFPPGVLDGDVDSFLRTARAASSK